MKKLPSFRPAPRALGTLLLFGVGLVLVSGLSAAEQSPPADRESFATVANAIQSLETATEAKDQVALHRLFGSGLDALLTGDAVLDARHANKFAALLAQENHVVNEGPNKVTLEVGEQRWPMPIPLVRLSGRWFFDTAAGQEEIIDRHIGKDELHAIGVCRAYVLAQRKYAELHAEAGQGIEYAQLLLSTPGKKDGLYWTVKDGEAPSPFSHLVAEAEMEGYDPSQGSVRHPFHGYFFRILTRQGKADSGGAMDYIHEGRLTGGFALVAYPEKWDHSGIMTFIVNQDGQVYQRDFGEETIWHVSQLNEYNPNQDWTLVQDEGIQRASSER